MAGQDKNRYGRVTSSMAKKIAGRGTKEGGAIGKEGAPFRVFQQLIAGLKKK
jgi:hypothetical protein